MRLNTSGDIVAKNIKCPTCIEFMYDDGSLNPYKSAMGFPQPSGYKTEAQCLDCRNLRVILGEFSIFCRRTAEILFDNYLKQWRWYCVSIIDESDNLWHKYLKRNGMELTQATEAKDCMVIRDPDWVFREEAKEKNISIPMELAEKIAVLNSMPPI